MPEAAEKALAPLSRMFDAPSRTAQAESKSSNTKIFMTEAVEPAAKRKRSVSIIPPDSIGSVQEPVPYDATIPSQAKLKSSESSSEVASKHRGWRIPIMSIGTSGVVIDEDEAGPALALVYAPSSNQFLCYCGNISLCENISSLRFDATTVFSISQYRFPTHRYSCVRLIVGNSIDCRRVIDLQIETTEDCKSLLSLLLQLSGAFITTE